MAYKVVSVSPTFGYYVRTPIDFLKERGCDVELFSQDKKEGLSKYLKDVDAIIVARDGKGVAQNIDVADGDGHGG